ncbi:unnamed protein product [Durusdinium trenchii]|uniref:Uncharacterized protein n=2 Tax=Durusdinium trenchii TaxID=1381693 RepID=A0ABP0RRQ2_9DINO
MAEISVSPSRELHVPKNREGLMDEKALKRANRLAGVGQSVASMDLKAVAETYKSQAGSSGIEAAAAAAAALNAALKASLHGGVVDQEECLKVAQQEVQKAATKRARQAQGEAVLAARVAEVGYEGQARSEAMKLAHDAHFTKVMANRNDRLAEDTATKRAIREERAAAAASRRCLSEARARFGHRWPSVPVEDSAEPSAYPSLLADDPVVRRARALCSGVAQAVSQLEEQNQMLKNKPSLQINLPRSQPAREQKTPKPFQGPFDNEVALCAVLSADNPHKRALQSWKPAARRPQCPSACTTAMYRCLCRAVYKEPCNETVAYELTRLNEKMLQVQLLHTATVVVFIYVHTRWMCKCINFKPWPPTCTDNSEPRGS